MASYVMLLRWKPGLTQEQMDGALMRRAGWKYPAGSTPIAEYWPMAHDPAVVSVFDADRVDPIMETMFAWGDVFDITVLPAVSAEIGLSIGAEAMARARGA